MELGPIGKLLHQRALKRWRHAARNAAEADLSALRALRQQARQLRAPLEELAFIAEDRLTLPRVGSNTFHKPAGTDWSWRPMAWRAQLPVPGIANVKAGAPLSEELHLFHNCPDGQLTLRQLRNTKESDFAPYGVQLEVLHFQGAYLSLVVDLPKAVCKGLKKRHLIHLGAVIEREAPMTIYARINIKNGPNTEQLLLTLPDDGHETMVEFDLAYTHLNEKKSEKIWVDLMFDNPQMNRVTIRDLNFSRYPRADI